MKISLLFLLFAVCISTVCEPALSLEFFRGAMSSALGHTGRAGLDSAESAFINPALLPLMPNNGMNIYYRDGYLEDGQHRHAVGAGVFDNSEEVFFPGSLHYLRLRDTGKLPTPVEGEVWHAALGYQAHSRWLLGASLYRLNHRQEGTSFEQWNGSLGTLFKITPDLGVALVIENPAHPGSEVPQNLREDLQTAIGFFGTVAEAAHLRFDLSRRERDNPDGKMAYMFGIETRSLEYLLVRAGFKRDEWSDQNLWTAGLCFNGPRLKLDYAFEKTSTASSGALHSVDLRLPF